MRLLCIKPTKTLTKDVFYDAVPLTTSKDKKLVQQGVSHRTAKFFKVMNDNCKSRIYKASRFK